MTAAGFTLWVIAVCAIVGGLFALGIWVGRGAADDRRRQADNDALEVRTREITARSTLMLEAPRPRMPTGRPNYHPADYIAPADRMPGYAEAFPRPGYMPAAPPLDALDVGPARPSPSPVDLEADVQRMILESEIYMAELIAHTRHTERNYLW